jgi:hypothetical protein
MASINFTFSGNWSAADLDINKSDPRDNLQRLQRFLEGLQNGTYSSNITQSASGTDAVRAVSEVTATTSGNLGTVINGTTVTTTFTTDQAGTAAKAISDINANTTVNKWVTASAGSTTTKFYVTANLPGEFGNMCTLTVTGTGASATGAGKLATGAGNNGQPTTFAVG